MRQVRLIGLFALFALLRVVAAHGANSQALDENFDHLSTGFPLVGLHALQRCESCHIDAVFQGLPTQCAGCHDGKLARGKHVNHVPTVQQCDVCHTTRGFAISAKMDHSATSAPCASCHNGVQASGKNADHFETTPNCAACHRTLIWAPAITFDHSEILSGVQCFACHDGKRSQGKSTSHVQSSNECALCHTTRAFRPTKKVDHRAIKESCDSAGCHSQPVVHATTSRSCNRCHNVTAWKPVVMTKIAHKEVSISRCSECHPGKIQSVLVSGINAPGQPADHIPTPQSCDVCHTTIAWLPATFTHAGVTSNCVQCHTNGIRATPKPVTHLKSSNVCEKCHVSMGPGLAAWLRPFIKFDHLEALGTCSSCHNNVISKGKGPTHIVTSLECNSCHKTDKWLGAAVDHSGITSGCTSCHDGVKASGIAGKHLAGLTTSPLCESCHNKFPAKWKPITKFDHAQTSITVCSTCHNGTLATGQSATTHIPTTQTCNTCHTVAAWKPASVDHTGFTGNCASCHGTPGFPNVSIMAGKHLTGLTTSTLCDTCHSKAPGKWKPILKFDHTQTSITVCAICHNGSLATGQSATTHIPTTQSCNTCHTVAAWKPAPVDHASFTGNCASCHGTPGFPNVSIMAGKHKTGINTSNVCEACHGKAPAKWKPILKFDHLQIQPATACATCHDGTSTLALKGKSAQHIPTTLACEACHTSTTVWTGAKVNHTILTATCVSCHTGTASTFIGAQGKVGKHLIGLNTSNECEKCHNVSPAGWKPARTFDHIQIQPATACAICHDGSGKLAIKGKGPTHVITALPCDACHATNAWTPAGVDHSTITSNCISCHDRVKASGIAGKHLTGLTTSSLCETCHNKFPAKWNPILKFDHTQTSIIVCATCHGTGLAKTGKPANHIPTLAACDTCHKSVANWTTVDTNHSAFVNLCVNCHTGTYLGARGKAGKHIAGLQTSDICEACHAKKPSAWAPILTFNHNQATNPSACSSCHNGTLARGISPTHPRTSPNCGNCHTDAVALYLWKRPLPGQMNHTETASANCGDAGCHATTRSVSHITIKLPPVCDACHLSTSTWRTTIVDHNQVSGSCFTCHNGITAKGKSGLHNTVPLITDMCGACHFIPPQTFASHKTPFPHRETTATCVSCHVVTFASFRYKTSGHMTTTENCNACHTTSGWIPASTNHTAVTGTCEHCHNGSTKGRAKTTGHCITTRDCKDCHGSTSAWASNITNLCVVAVTPTPGPVPTPTPVPGATPTPTPRPTLTPTPTPRPTATPTPRPTPTPTPRPTPTPTPAPTPTPMGGGGGMPGGGGGLPGGGGMGGGM